jgi:hypothetical protein
MRAEAALHAPEHQNQLAHNRQSANLTPASMSTNHHPASCEPHAAGAQPGIRDLSRRARYSAAHGNRHHAARYSQALNFLFRKAPLQTIAPL